MRRRHLLELAGVAALTPRQLLGLGTRQDILQPVSYPQFAVGLAQTYHGVSARTELQSATRETASRLYDSAVALMNEDIRGARAAVDSFENEANDQLPSLSRIAEERSIVEYHTVIRQGITQCRSDIDRFEQTGEIIVDRLTLARVLCLLRAPSAFEPCLGPLWKRGLVCALGSIPMARLGVNGYAAAVCACLLDDFIDVAVDVLVDCFPDFRNHVQACFG